MMTTIIPLICFIAGALIAFFVAQSIFPKRGLIQDMQTQIDDFRQQNSRLLIDNATLVSANDTLKENNEALKLSMVSMGQTFKAEFQNMANEILEAKTKSLDDINVKNIKNILDPLNKDIKEFKDQVQKVYHEEAKERYSLGNHIKTLVETSNKVGQQAENLTIALKGNVKQQGNWGEMILESILENSGLVKDREYFLQEFIKDKSGVIIKDENGNALQPDVTIQYPDERKVIVDSKVSLVAWEQYVTQDNPDVQKQQLDNHIKSLKAHIDGLSRKNYPKYAKALDYVIMFVPVEPAFLEAVKHDTGLWKYAYDKKILIVGPTNLLLVLKIIADMWQIEKQTKNAIAIAEKAGELYDKLYGFVDSMNDLGVGLRKANENFDKAMGQLSTGKGNAIKRAEEMKQLGAQTKKQFPDKLIADAGQQDT